ncbi:MAG TPA: hypothetical protein VD866_02700 [Urbifossiella sp.]|nr:hypothetical protein [Urbifossiella sp.]
MLSERGRRQRLTAAKEMERLETERNRRLAERGRHRLSDFLRAAWHQVEPGRALVWGWHLDAICEHLEAVTAGQLNNLLITIPPGCTKSRTVGVFWPAWTWLPNRWAECRWLFFSNSDELATRESMACRRLLESEWYRLHYPDAVKITTDQNTKTWYENERAGHRQSMSMFATATGKKGDIICVDDANDAEKVQGEANRNQINNRWDQAIYDRVIDFKTGRRVLIGQRTHKDDLLGHVRETGEFEELCIPEEFEPSRRRTMTTGWTDPRKAEGEFLRPDQFGPALKAAAVKRLGTAGYRAKHQQDPMSKEGYRFKAAWLKRRWRRDPSSPDFVVLEDERGAYRFKLTGTPRFATADGAASAKRTADRTAVGVWANSPRGDLLWLDCVARRLEIPDQPKLLEEVYARHKFKSIGVEAVASNRALFQFAQRQHLAAIPLDPKGLDKLAHAQGALILAEAGSLWLPDPVAVPGFPLDDVLNELLQFAGTKEDAHDDLVDVLSYAVDMRPRVGAASGGAAPFAVDPARPR